MPKTQEHKLENLLSHTEPVFVVHMFISNQQKIRNTLKDRWSTIVPMLELQIGKLLQDRMVPEDILLRKETLNYYVICPGRDETESSSHTERLAAGICEKIFCTDKLLEDLQINLYIFPVQPTDFANPDSLRSHAFAHNDSEGRSMTVGRHNYASCRPEHINNKLVRQISGLRSTCDSFFLKLNRMPDEDEELLAYRAALARIAEATKIVNQGIGKILDNHAALPASNPAPKKHAVPDSPPVAAAPAVSSVPSVETKLQNELAATIGEHAEMVYFPIWDVKKQLVNSYRATIVRHLPAETVELNCGVETEIAAHLIDWLLVQKTQQDNIDDEDADDASSFILPLHINTLQSAKHFTKIEMRLKALSIMQRKRLKIEVIGATRNTIFETIKKLVAKVRIYCTSVSFRLAPGVKPSANFKKAGISSVGFHITDLLYENANIDKEIEQLVLTSEKLHLSSFVYGVDSIAEAATSIGSGVNFISGQTIGNALEIPWGTLPFEVESLYARVLSS